MSMDNRLVGLAEEVLLSNMVYFRGFRVIVPHRRAYPVPYCWDTAFHVWGLLALGRFNEAAESVEAILHIQRGDGLIPNAPSEVRDKDLRSQPPILIDSVYSYLALTGDYERVKRWFPRLEKFWRWWRINGDPLGEGVISPFSGSRDKKLLAYKAACSTGMDNHNVYDCSNGNVERIGEYYYLPMHDILLTSLVASSALFLSHIAKMLRLYDKEETYLMEFKELQRKFMKVFWSQSEGFAYPRMWGGERVEIYSVQAFTPLYSGILSQGECSRLVKHLETKRFLNPHGVLTIAESSEGFMSKNPEWYPSHIDPYYWRGPIWAPPTFFLICGLLRYGYMDTALKILNSWINLVVQNGFWEYYYPDGRPGAKSVDGYSWTASLSIVAEKILGEMRAGESSFFNCLIPPSLREH